MQRSASAIAWALAEPDDALLEVPEHRVALRHPLVSPVAGRVAEMPEEHIFRHHDLVRAAVLVVVHRVVREAGAPLLAPVVLLGGEMLLAQLLEQVEVVHVDPGAPLRVQAAEVLVDTARGDGRLADGGGEQVRADDVAGDEVPGPVGHAEERVGVDQAAAVVQLLQPVEVAALPDGGDQEIGLDLELGPLARHRPAVDHVALGEA